MTDQRWKNYVTLVESNDGYHFTTVRELLTVAGRQAAGVRIVEGIEQKLATHHLGHFPPRIPRDQNAHVLLYSQDHIGLGQVLYLVRQLIEAQHASTGTTAEAQVMGLAYLLDVYRVARQKDVDPA